MVFDFGAVLVVSSTERPSHAAALGNAVAETVIQSLVFRAVSLKGVPDALREPIPLQVAAVRRKDVRIESRSPSRLAKTRELVPRFEHVGAESDDDHAPAVLGDPRSAVDDLTTTNFHRETLDLQHGRPSWRANGESTTP